MGAGGLMYCKHKELTKVQKQLLMLDDWNDNHFAHGDDNCDHISDYFVEQNQQLMGRDLHVMIEANQIQKKLQRNKMIDPKILKKNKLFDKNLHKDDQMAKVIDRQLRLPLENFKKNLGKKVNPFVSFHFSE